MMLNYDDFVSQPLAYKYVLARWMGIERMEVVEDGLSMIDNHKGSKDAIASAWEMMDREKSPRSKNGMIAPQSLKGLKEKVVGKFYSENAKANAPLFYDDSLVAKPDTAMI